MFFSWCDHYLCKCLLKRTLITLFIQYNLCHFAFIHAAYLYITSSQHCFKAAWQRIPRGSIRIPTQPFIWRLIIALCTSQEGAGPKTPGWHHCSQTPPSSSQSSPATDSGGVSHPPKGTKQEAAGKCRGALHTLVLHQTAGRLSGEEIRTWINEQGSMLSRDILKYLKTFKSAFC